MELADFQKMEQIRARAEADVADKDTAESLTYYRQFVNVHVSMMSICRVLIYPVCTIDTDGVGVERFTQAGLVATVRVRVGLCDLCNWLWWHRHPSLGV